MVTGCSWVTAERLIAHRAFRTLLCGRAATSGPTRGCSTRWPMRLCAPMTASWALTCLRPRWTGRSTRRPAAVTGTGKSPVDRGKLGWKWSLLTDRNGIPVSWAADGAKTATTSPCSSRPSPPPAGCLPTWRPCIWTAATTTAPSRRARPTTASTDVVCAKRRKRGAAALQDHSPAGVAMGHRAHQLVAVELRAATPQHRPPATTPPRPHSPSPSPCCSPPNSSTGETAGTPDDRLPAHALSLDPPMGL